MTGMKESKTKGEEGLSKGRKEKKKREKWKRIERGKRREV